MISRMTKSPSLGLSALCGARAVAQTWRPVRAASRCTPVNLEAGQSPGCKVRGEGEGGCPTYRRPTIGHCLSRSAFRSRSSANPENLTLIQARGGVHHSTLNSQPEPKAVYSQSRCGKRCVPRQSVRRKTPPRPSSTRALSREHLHTTLCVSNGLG